jgi:hypothetical protein
LPGEKSGDGESGWDLTRLKAGEAYWMRPLKADDLDMLIAFYVRPIMVEGEYVGVVSIGVDFDTITDQVKSMRSYKTGYGFLTDFSGDVMYHPSIPFGVNLTEDDEDVPVVDEAMRQGVSEGVITYTYKGAEKSMVFHRLQNDMRLALSVDASEIYAQRDRLVSSLVSVGLIATAALVSVSMVLGRQALKPLERLTASAKEVAAGCASSVHNKQRGQSRPAKPSQQPVPLSWV